MHNIDTFVGRKTMIVGDINTGKTARTLAILQHFMDAGWAAHITVIDLAPDAHGNVGGKMPVPADAPLRHLTGPVVPPRLTAANDEQAQQLAHANALMINGLFEHFKARPSKILFINDASLYLQAGAMRPFQAVLELPDTVILNAYLGDSFPDSPLTRRERKMAQELIRLCDRIIRTDN